MSVRAFGTSFALPAVRSKHPFPFLLSLQLLQSLPLPQQICLRTSSHHDSTPRLHESSYLRRSLHVIARILRKYLQITAPLHPGASLLQTFAHLCTSSHVTEPHLRSSSHAFTHRLRTSQLSDNTSEHIFACLRTPLAPVNVETACLTFTNISKATGSRDTCFYFS